MINYDDLAHVSAEADNEVKEVGFEAVFNRHGITPDAAVEVARQRALRAYLLRHGRSIPSERERVQVPEGEAGFTEISAYGAVWLDGLVTGLRIWEKLRPREGHRRT